MDVKKKSHKISHTDVLAVSSPPFLVTHCENTSTEKQAVLVGKQGGFRGHDVLPTGKSQEHSYAYYCPSKHEQCIPSPWHLNLLLDSRPQLPLPHTRVMSSPLAQNWWSTLRKTSRKSKRKDRSTVSPDMRWVLDHDADISQVFMCMHFCKGSPNRSGSPVLREEAQTNLRIRFLRQIDNLPWSELVCFILVSSNFASVEGNGPWHAIWLAEVSPHAEALLMWIIKWLKTAVTDRFRVRGNVYHHHHVSDIFIVYMYIHITHNERLWSCKVRVLLYLVQNCLTQRSQHPLMVIQPCLDAVS